MAVPKRKVSKARRDKRRSNVWKLDMPGMTECPQCHEMKLSHRVCPNCGYYAGKEVLKDGKIVKEAAPVKEEKKEAEAPKKAPAKKVAAKKTTASKAEKAVEEPAAETAETSAE